MKLNPAFWSLLLVGAVAGSGSGAAHAEESSTIEKCGKKFGTITVVDPRSGLGQLQSYGLGSPAALLRMMIQQSGCFDVVERGVAMRNMQQERALAQSGQLRDDSNIGQGQMQVADFVLTPDVQIPTSTTGGVGGVGGGAGSFGKLGGLFGAVAAGVKFKEAQTSLLIADVRSGIQVAGAEGKAKTTTFNLASVSAAAGALGALGGYTSSPEGKVVSASLLDNFNKIVILIRDKPQLIQPTTAEAVANAAGSTHAEAPLPAGQMLTPKIANVKIYSEPSRDSALVATLQRGEELVASGEVKNGFARVDAANFSGWVQRTLVGPMGAATPLAIAPIPTAPTLPATPMVMPTPQSRYGTFSGTAEGSDTGYFRLSISDKGDVNGDGRFTRLGGFGLMGSYEPTEGTVQMLGSSGGGGVMFRGRYDASRGVISGSWFLTNGLAVPLMTGGAGGGGSFVAQRQ